MRRTPGLEVTDPRQRAPLDGEEDLADARLVNLARFLQSRLLTNDANLARVARLQNLSVLNLNDLAAAMQPTLSVGDELELIAGRRRGATRIRPWATCRTGR